MFQLPSAEELEEEKRMPPDMTVVHKRIQDVVGVLMDFTRRRCGGATRADYLALLSADIGNYYGYNEELVSQLVRVVYLVLLSVCQPVICRCVRRRSS
jgi:25S rRNA (cytosine2870-C5)-methyltransferase